MLSARYFPRSLTSVGLTLTYPLRGSNLNHQNTNGLGLIHEGVNIHNGSDYTRPWSAWANSHFAEMVLDLAKRKPRLIFKDNKPYDISKDLVL